MKLESINKNSIEKISNVELISLHRRIHQLAALGYKQKTDLKNVHSILIKEMNKRGLNHKSEYKEKEMKLKEDITFLSEDDLILEHFETIHKKIEKIKSYYRKKRKELDKERENHFKKLRDDAKEYAKDTGEGMGRSMSDDYAAEIQSRREKLRGLYMARKTILNREEMIKLMRLQKMERIGKVGIIISSFVLASALIHQSYKVYKQDLKLYSEFCKTKSGREREICLKNQKIKSIKKRIAFLNSISFKCNQSKDPVQCKARLHKEILKLRGVATDYLSKTAVDVTSGSSLYD